MQLTAENVSLVLQQWPCTGRYLIGYSGGVDSHVLLHVMEHVRRLRADDNGPPIALCAVHVHHHLCSDADDWERHCRKVCKALAVNLTVLHIDAKARIGESPEAAARLRRYQALRSEMQPGAVLVTAHHLDDQVETLLLQLLRGGGPHGLAAMPASTKFDLGTHVRPLLHFSRDDILEYATRHQLHWIDDQSNQDRRYDRNYLRHRVMPLFAERWPSYRQTLQRAGSLQYEAAQIIDATAETDLLSAMGENQHQLRIEVLLQLPEHRIRNVLRLWFRTLNLCTPTAKHLGAIVHNMLPARWDATPLLRWEDVEIRRYRSMLYAMSALSSFDCNLTFPWGLQQPLRIPQLAQQLISRIQTGAGLSRSKCDGGVVSVSFRRGGERCTPMGQKHSRSLKKLLQENGIPPWQRSRIPLIYVGEQLAAVVGFWVCEPFAAAADESGYVIEQLAI